MCAIIIRLPQVKEQTGLSRSGIYQLIEEGLFPKQIKLSKRSSGWLEEEVQEWIKDRVAERDTAA